MNRLIIWSVLLSSLCGCSSIQSTALNRVDNDMFVGNSNGDARCHGQAAPFKGVPITVRVPTHLDVSIKESIDIYVGDDQSQLQTVQGPRRSLFVEATPIETEKVFTVDISRPPAGNMDYTLDFDSKGDSTNPQYFREVKAKFVDETIADVNTALTSLLPILTTPTARSTSTTNVDLITEVRTVAWKRFDIDSPAFEEDVAAWVEQHLNCCRDCRSSDEVGRVLAEGPTPPQDVVPPALEPAPAPAPQDLPNLEAAPAPEERSLPMPEPAAEPDVSVNSDWLQSIQ